MILLLSTSDTDLLSRPRRGAAWRPANPAPRRRTCPRCSTAPTWSSSASSAGAGTGRTGSTPCSPAGKPVVVLGGEQAPDAELMELSTVPAGVAAQAHAYLAQGGPENLAQLHAFLSDTVLLTGEGFAPPRRAAELGRARPRPCPARTARPSPSSTTAPSSSPGTPPSSRRCADAIEDAGRPGAAGLLRVAAAGRARAAATLRAADALVVTVLAAGGTKPASASAGGDDEAWDVERARRAGRPDPAGALPDQQPRRRGRPATTGSRRSTSRPRSPSRSSTAGSSPCRSRSRRSTPTGCRSTSPTPSAPPASPASPSRTPGCGTSRRASKRIALMLSAYPTKHARIGNAVGLDTPASAVRAAARPWPRPATTSGRRRSRLPGRRRAGRRRADPRADRGRRAGPGLADRGAAGRQPDPDPGARLPRAGSTRCPTTSASGVERALGPGARRAVRRRRGRDRPRRPAQRQRRADGAAAARLRREPGRDLPRPRPAAVAPLPGRLPLAGRAAGRGRLRRRRGRAPRQARQPGVAARQDAGHVARAAAPTPRSATCRWSTRSWSTTRARARRPSAARTPRSSTT